MELETGMEKEERVVLGGGLSKLLADVYVLYVKTQNIHWNLHGPEFYSLHNMTEKQYQEMAENIDEIAERIRALGFFVEGSMEAFLKASSIKEDHKVHSKHQYLESLLHCHESVICNLRSIGVLAADHKDHATSDMVGRLMNFHEKAAWMLRSSL